MVNKSDFTSSGPRLFLRRGKYEFAFESVNFLLKNQRGEDRRPNFVIFVVWSAFFLLGLTPCKAGQPLQSMKLQKKEAQKD